jgi:hypothetical protein
VILTPPRRFAAPALRRLLPAPLLAALGLLALAGCAELTSDGPAPGVSKGAEMVFDLPRTLPPQRGFPPGPPVGTSRPNSEIAADFLDLEFLMESGRALPALTRFEGPITVALSANAPPTAEGDLNLLIGRLRSEAGLDLRRVTGPAAVTISFHPKAELQRIVPTAACFVAPNVSSLAEYRSRRGTDAVDWARLDRRTRVTIFVPLDTSPQEVRDCLHEELAQAIGPLNDLYRLPDSVFNDDNFHTVLTGFDMLVLRLHYAPEMQGAPSRAEAAARLPEVLARLNPAGERTGGSPGGVGPRAWIDAVETAFGSKAPLAVRQRAASRALAIAQAEGWQDARLGFSHFIKGRLLTGTDLAAAAAQFEAAGRVYARLPGAAVHGAHVQMQLAAFALSEGRAEEAIARADRALPDVMAAQNAALLATLLQIKAEALDSIGRPSEARAVRAESLGWARYGFGPDILVIARMADIAALAASGRGG